MSRIVGRIVVGVSGSPNSLHALRHAVALAEQYAALMVPVLAWSAPSGGFAALRGTPTAMNRAGHSAAEHQLLTAFEEGLGGLPTTLDVNALIVRGEAGPVLVGVADRENDLLVIGSGRRGAIGRLVVSRVARYCLAEARCAVIMVPPPPLAGQSQLRRGRLRALALRRANDSRLTSDGAGLPAPRKRRPG